MPDLSEFDTFVSTPVLQASFDGRLKSNEKFLSVTGDLAKLTASSGKDLYIVKAKITYFANATSPISTADNEVVLKINGSIVETTNHSVVISTSGGGGGMATSVYKFENMGFKVIATEIIKLEVISINTKIDIEGFIQAIEVPTGQNPIKYTGV